MFWKKEIPDKVLIVGLKQEGVQRQRYENYLYDTYAYLVRVGIKKHQLAEEEALNAYTDAVLAVIRNVETDRFKGGSTLKTYLIGIFFRKCVDLIRQKTTKQLKTLPVDDFFNLGDSVKSILETIILKEKVEDLNQKIQQLGKKCHAILEKWASGYSDKEIAQIQSIGLKNATTVKASRHRCIKKLREI